MNKPYRLFSFLSVLLMLVSAQTQAEPIQTQMSMDGALEVDVTKAKVDGNTLMVVLTYRNSGQEAAEIQYPVEEVYFVDKSENKKYHVLRDSKEAWLAAPVARGSIAKELGFSAGPVKVKPGGKALVWFKFPAPPAATTSIDLTIPGALPFDNLAITR